MHYNRNKWASSYFLKGERLVIAIYELINIGKKEARRMFGEKLINHPNFDGGISYTIPEQIEEYGNFEFYAGATDEPFDTKDFQLGDETPDKYCVLLSINPYTGEVTRDYEHSRLPKDR